MLDNKRDGVYPCRLCRLPLFAAPAKLDSGTGWPSFFESLDPDHIRSLHDTRHGTLCIEICCQRCDCHLGHVFRHGARPTDTDVGSAEGRRERPRPTGWRNCLNSIAMGFREQVEHLLDAAKLASL